MFLPDVNLWLALTFQAHEHHTTAREWFEQVSADGCAFCRLTQQGFLRLATNPRVVGENALSLAGAWEAYDTLLADARVVTADEPADLEAAWRTYTRRRSFSPNIWSDAYLAAFARAASFELVTLDQGFRQYKGVACTILS